MPVKNASVLEISEIPGAWSYYAKSYNRLVNAMIKAGIKREKAAKLAGELVNSTKNLTTVFMENDLKK